MEEPMVVDNDGGNATTLTPERLQEITESPESLGKKLAYCNQLVARQEILNKKLHALLRKTSKNTKLLNADDKTYNLEYDEVSNDVEKLKVLAENLEQKLQSFQQNPSSDPLLQAEEHVQNRMRLREVQQNPDEANLTSEISQFEEKIRTLQSTLAQLDECARDTKLKISKFEVPKVISHE